MKISIFGLGYVGCVGAACLAKLGHQVIGVDVNENKVRLMNEGKPTIIEEGIAELCAEAHEKGLMRATTDVKDAVMNTDVSFIVVGTPSSKEGHLNLSYIYNVAQQIGDALRGKELKSEGVNELMGGLRHIIAIRSTVLPGTNEKVGKMIEEASGLVRGKDFTVVSNPEFLREGTSVEDYFNPPLTLVGIVCIQQIKLNTTNVNTPYISMNLIVGVRNIDHHRIAVLVKLTLDGQRTEVLCLVVSNLLTVHRQTLREVAETIQETHSTHIDI